MKIILVAFAFAMLSACAVSPPNYNSTPQSQSTLRHENLQQAAVGSFTASDPALEKLAIRASTLTPRTGTFSGDIRQALEFELSQASLLKPAASTSITGTLLKNELDGSGISEGHASMSVEFVVHRREHETYRATKSVDHTWASSFAGVTAIPAAAQGYVRTIEKLIADLIADPEFQEALK